MIVQQRRYPTNYETCPTCHAAAGEYCVDARYERTWAPRKSLPHPKRRLTGRST
jgi:hypothetical protein